MWTCIECGHKYDAQTGDTDERTCYGCLNSEDIISAESKYDAYPSEGGAIWRLFMRSFKRDGFIKFAWYSWHIVQEKKMPFWQFIWLLPTQYNTYLKVMKMSNKDIDSFLEVTGGRDETHLPN
tara:strand:+ start:161 stop:529 length:369 start_codon:yes stop_codon:yes gene_type:complete